MVVTYFWLWISDFLLTNFERKTIVRVNEDYNVLQTYKFYPDSEIVMFQARCRIGEKLMLLWVDQTEFLIRYIDSQSFMTPPDGLQFNSETNIYFLFFFIFFYRFFDNFFISNFFILNIFAYSKLNMY